MTVQEFKQQLKKLGFEPDRTSECKDMMVNLRFQFPIDLKHNVWTAMRVAVCFFIEGQANQYFQIQLATFDNKRWKWGTWTKALETAPNASQVLFYAFNSIRTKYKPNLLPL